MAKATELKEEFWSALESDMTLMLGVSGSDGSHMRPMTAQLDEGPGPIWFFTATDNALYLQLARARKGIATFTSKNHGLFAALHGKLSRDNDEEMIDRLWNRFAAAWYEEGRDDPKLALLRFDPEEAEIWVNGSSFIAGTKMLLGMDPKKDYKDHVAKVKLSPRAPARDART